VARRDSSRAAGQTKAERRQARALRGGEPASTAGSVDAAGDSPSADGVEPRLARIADALAAQSGRIDQALASLTQIEADAARTAEPSWATSLAHSVDAQTAEGVERTLGLRRENVIAADQPLALICQAQRSGGTLLVRLFDGHPQCHAHPHELHIGDRRPHLWPALALDEDPDAWFERLKEEKVIGLFEKGRRTIPLKMPGERPEESNYPCLLPPAFQRLIFLEEVERRAPITSERQILDAYMTSLFNAWLDNQNLRGAEKRWVVAFSPRRAWAEGREKLFELYPDGRLISILRDPLSWFTSAQGRDPEADPQTLLEHWKRSTQEMIDAKGRYGGLVFIVRFDELVRNTEKTMRALAKFLEIDYDPVLTTPTFNGYPVGANSSYEVRSTGVVTDPVERHKELLSDEQRERILGECDELHKEALKLVDTRRASSGARGAAKKKPAQRPKTTKKSSTRSPARSTTRKRSTSAKR
jgi:hypothetical protein